MPETLPNHGYIGQGLNKTVGCGCKTSLFNPTITIISAKFVCERL